MKQFLFWLVVAAGLAARRPPGTTITIYRATAPAASSIEPSTVRRGDVTQVVNSTGTVQPVLSVQIGSFVSGPVIKRCSWTSTTTSRKNNILAKVDPRIYKAALASATAALLHSQADLIRVKALLDQATHDEKRAVQLHPTNAISETDFDQCRGEPEIAGGPGQAGRGDDPRGRGQPGNGRSEPRIHRRRRRRSTAS